MARARVKRFLLVVLIASLVAAALVGAGIFILGSAGDLEGRVLLTVLLLGFFSLTGLCASLRLERGLSWLGWLGILASLAGLAYSEVLVWEVIPVEGFDEIKPALSLGVAAAALAYGSLVLLARGPYRSVNVVVWLTVILVLAIAGALVGAIVTEIEPPDSAVRALGAAGVLALLGTMLAPLLRKFLTLGEGGPPPGPSARERGGRHRAKAARRRTEVKGV
ncbi:MAG TPA: hypothetical protein VGR49_01600 [Actinomycetota bacterium]|nr:hypothetical protein [Actinomycetota bacterium]